MFIFDAGECTDAVLVFLLLYIGKNPEKSRNLCGRLILQWIQWIRIWCFFKKWNNFGTKLLFFIGDVFFIIWCHNWFAFLNQWIHSVVYRVISFFSACYFFPFIIYNNSACNIARALFRIEQPWLLKPKNWNGITYDLFFCCFNYLLKSFQRRQCM